MRTPNDPWCVTLAKNWNSLQTHFIQSERALRVLVMHTAESYK